MRMLVGHERYCGVTMACRYCGRTRLSRMTSWREVAARGVQPSIQVRSLNGTDAAVVTYRSDFRWRVFRDERERQQLGLTRPGPPGPDASGQEVLGLFGSELHLHGSRRMLGWAVLGAVPRHVFVERAEDDNAVVAFLPVLERWFIACM